MAGGGGAERLAKIFCTEEDKVNCPFYFKIGACRHGDRCSRFHNKPMISQTLLLAHMYQNHPAAVAAAEGQMVAEEYLREAQKHFEEFYEEVFMELANYGEVEELNICDNIGDHLVGNVYAKFASEDDAQKALTALSGRYYAERPIMVEFSPVIDFREARCRQFEETTCTRGGYCNFMHLKYVSRSVKRDLFRQMYEEHPEYKRRKDGRRSRSRSRSPGRRDDRRRDNKGGDRDRRDRDRDSRDHRRHRSRSADRKDRREKSPARQSSEERRAMIEQWNREAEGGSSSAAETATTITADGLTATTYENGAPAEPAAAVVAPEPQSVPADEQQPADQ